MTRGFLPNTDSGLLSWSGNFLARLSVSPESFGLSQSVVDEFAAVQEGYATALAAALAPQTRTRPAVCTKNAARETLKSAARRVAHLVEGYAGLTDAQRALIGLTIRKAPTRISPAEEAPAVFITNVDGHQLTVRLQDASNGRNTLPARMAGANLYWSAGEDAPTSVAQCTYYGSTTRTRITMTLPAAVLPGATVWVLACWLNPRSQPGPTSRPRSARIQFDTSPRLAA